MVVRDVISGGLAGKQNFRDEREEDLLDTTVKNVSCNVRAVDKGIDHFAE